jgi:hypothetical protein
MYVWSLAERESQVVDSFVAKSNGFNSVPVQEYGSQHNYVETDALSFEPRMDMKESLELILGAEDENRLPSDERLVRRERRFDLLVWLLNLNLDPRLGPYGGAESV